MSLLTRVRDFFTEAVTSTGTSPEELVRDRINFDEYQRHRVDGWFSTLSGFGTTRDKRTYSSFQAEIVTDQIAQELWRSDDLAARVVETIPREAMRRGFEVRLGEGEAELAEEISGRLEELNASAVIQRAKEMERAYGGSAVWPVINDSQVDGRMTSPLNEDRISTIKHLQVFEPRELQPLTYYDDPLEPKFGEPKTYRLQPISRGGVMTSFSGLEIHESRLIVFPGIRVSRQQSTSNMWGDSVLGRVWVVLRDFNIAWAATGVLLHDFSQASIKLKGLAELMASDKDQVIRNRLTAIELARSTIKATLLDAEEEYERKQTPVSGLAELLDRFATRVAAAADMPLTLLMGQSPAGLNATGESDVRFFYDRVAAVQQTGIRPQLERLVYLVMRSLDGPTRGKEPDTWSVEFNPLWQPSEQEVAQTRLTVAQTDQIYAGMQAVSPDEVARSRWSGDTYSADMKIDWKERERVERALEEQAKAEAAAGVAPGSQPPAPGQKPPAEGEDQEVAGEADVETVDVDDDGEPDEEYATIDVAGHKRRYRLRRKK